MMYKVEFLSKNSMLNIYDGIISIVYDDTCVLWIEYCFDGSYEILRNSIFDTIDKYIIDGVDEI